MTNEEAAAILESEAEYLYSQDEPYNRQAFNMAIEALQERKTGKWEIKYSKHGVIFPICSNCDYAATNWVKTKHCPNCGAKMKED